MSKRAGVPASTTFPQRSRFGDPRPSNSYQIFLLQLNAEGSEKADGFDRRAFDRLTPDERPRVEQMLVDALARGDDTAAEGLVLFDRARAPRLLAGALGRVAFESGVGANIAGQAWALTRDPRYQDELAKYLRHPSASTRLIALGYLKQTPPRPELAPALTAVVEEDVDPVNRSIAASLLLYWLGRIPDPDAAYRLERQTMADLTSDQSSTRRAGVARVLQRG